MLYMKEPNPKYSVGDIVWTYYVSSGVHQFSTFHHLKITEVEVRFDIRLDGWRYEYSFGNADFVDDESLLFGSLSDALSHSRKSCGGVVPSGDSSTLNILE